MAGVFEIFADTIVICTLTGLALLTSGVGFNSGSGSALCARAMSCVFGPRAGAAIIAAGMLLFAFSSPGSSAGARSGRTAPPSAPPSSPEPQLASTPSGSPATS